MQEALQQVLEVEMTEAVGSAPSSGQRGGWAIAPATTAAALVTRIGKLELRVPSGRDGRCSTSCSPGISVRSRRW